MNRIKITKRQKKILMIVGIVCLAFLIFIVAIYLPLRRQLVQLKMEYHNIESEINAIRSSGEGRSLEESISFLKGRLETLERQCPEKEEVVLRELSSLVARLGIEVTSIRPQRKKDSQDLNGVPINIKDYYVQEMPISMSLKTSYKTLGEFFKVLNEDLPIFIKMESVQIGKAAKEAANILNVELNLNVYLVCPLEKKG